MRIVQKFQEGKQVNRQTRHFVGHPYLTGGNAKETYNSLSDQFNRAAPYMNPEVKDNSEVELRFPYGINYGGIQRRINYNEGLPNDTIFSQLDNGYIPETGENTVILQRQAGVVHQDNYNPSNWALPKRGNWSKPLIIEGVPHYLVNGAYHPITKFH